jgi:outer membrane protein insertion porin family
MFSSLAGFSTLALGFLFWVTLYAPAKQVQKATIERIEIQGNHRYTEDVLRSRVKSNPGDICDEALLKLDLRSLYETGFFEKIDIDEKDGHTGKIVTFQVTEKPVIRALEFVGFEPLRMSDIEAYFKDHKIDFKVEGLFDPSKLRSAQKALEELLAQQGQRPDKLHTEIKQTSPTGIGVRFILDEKNAAPVKW